MNILAFNIGETLMKLVQDSGFAGFFADGGWRNLIMIAIACVLLYLGIVKKFEPLLLVGIAFGCLLTNLPGAGLYNLNLWDAYINGTAFTTASGEVIEHISFTDIIHEGGLLDIFYIGVKAGLYPSLIFMGVGAMTDFGPLICQPQEPAAWVRRHSWAFSLPSSARSAWASPAQRPLPSASSAAPTARRRSS